MHMKLIKIKGIVNPSKFEDYVASSLVDIAYIDEIIGDTITLSLESEIDLDNTEDRKWISELINEGLLECEELSAKIIW